MAQEGPTPDAWIGRDVHVRYVDADAPRGLDCTLEESNDRGVRVSAEGKTSFFPWGSIVRIDLGHGRPAGGLRVR